MTTEEFTVNGMGQQVNIAEHLTGEVGVDRETGRLSHVRYYAPDSFNPHRSRASGNSIIGSMWLRPGRVVRWCGPGLVRK